MVEERRRRRGEREGVGGGNDEGRWLRRRSRGRRRGFEKGQEVIGDRMMRRMKETKGRDRR